MAGNFKENTIVLSLIFHSLFLLGSLWLLMGCTIMKLPARTLDTAGKAVVTTGKIIETSGKVVETTGKVAVTIIKNPAAKEILTK